MYVLCAFVILNKDYLLTYLLTLLQTDNHTSIPPLSFLQAGCPSCRPTNSVKALKGNSTWSVISVTSVIRFTFGSSGQKEAEEEIKQQLAKPLFLYVGSQNVSVTI